MSEYGLKEYKALLEKAFKEYQNPDNCRFGMEPLTDGAVYRKHKLEILLWCLEMLPEIKE